MVLGNPDDEHLTVRNAGYLGMGGIPGAIACEILTNAGVATSA